MIQSNFLHAGFVVPCHRECMARRGTARGRGHFHCPSCDKLLGRRNTFIFHIKKIHNQGTPQSPSPGVNNLKRKLLPEEDNENAGKEMCKCVKCGKEYSQLSSLRRHYRANHQIGSRLPSVCLDPANGIFMVAQGSTGPLAPIHVVMHIMKGLIGCEDQDCLQIFKNIVHQNPGVPCIHINSTQDSEIAEVLQLKNESLENLQDMGIISHSTKENCLKERLRCAGIQVPLVAHADFSQLGYSTDCEYFSVSTEIKTHYCPLSRIRITFNKKSGEWSCCCPEKGRVCLHIAIAKWCAFETNPELVSNSSR